MQIINKVAVIGGAGKAGKYIVEQLLAEGIHLNILLRNPENFKIKSDLIKIIKGDVRDFDSVFELVSECDAVISSLGQKKGETAVHTIGSSNILKAIERQNIKRYILISGLTLDIPGDKKSFQTKLLTKLMKLFFPSIIKDKQAEYSLLQKSNIDWTIVRMPALKQTNENKPLKVSLTDCPGKSINSADLSVFIIEQLKSNGYIKKAPFISN
jgi:putative NADH-flavin reductase